MKSRIAKIVSKAEADNEMRRALLAEQDYELASTYARNSPELATGNRRGGSTLF